MVQIVTRADEIETPISSQENTYKFGLLNEGFSDCREDHFCMFFTYWRCSFPFRERPITKLLMLLEIWYINVSYCRVDNCWLRTYPLIYSPPVFSSQPNHVTLSFKYPRICRWPPSLQYSTTTSTMWPRSTLTSLPSGHRYFCCQKIGIPASMPSSMIHWIIELPHVLIRTIPFHRSPTYYPYLRRFRPFSLERYHLSYLSYFP